MNKKIVNVVSLGAALLFGKSASGSPIDIELHDVTLVKVQSITNREIDYGRYIDDMGKIYRLRVTLVSTSDLVKFAEKYHLRLITFFCDQKNINILTGAKHLYRDGKDVQLLGLIEKYGDTEVPKSSGLIEPGYIRVDDVYAKGYTDYIDGISSQDANSTIFLYSMSLLSHKFS